MMRSLWTAASGMIGQQSNLDVIANNLSNINSTGYKTQAANFKSLIYQTMQQKTTTSTGEAKPIGAQVGLGTRMASMSCITLMKMVICTRTHFSAMGWCR